MPRNTNTATLVYVNMLYGAGILKYGFRSRLKDSLRDNFGQVIIGAGIAIQGLVIGANSPKPTRASRRTALGHEGSFCSSDKAAVLRADGYRITRSKPSKVQGGKFGKTYYATVNGLKIAFLSNGENSIGSLAAGFPERFGIQQATNADAGDLVYGAEFPNLPVWDYLLENGKTFGSQTDPTAESALGNDENYKEKEAGVHTAAHFSAYYQIQAT